jgi:uncharacterized protein DUF6959
VGIGLRNIATQDRQAMERIEVEVYSQAVNAWLIRTPGRDFPAHVVQGDSLSQLFALAQSILDRARTCSSIDPELAEEAEELRDQLWGRVQHYEDVLGQAGFTLPYVRQVWPT